jgi:multidrug efflux pump
MARIWTFFTEKTALSYLLLVALAIFGLTAALTIQRESAPEVQIPIAVITSALSGASPEDIENLIVVELEKAVTNIDNVKKVTSTSREGVGSVVVEFEASADIKDSIDKVKDEVDRVKGNLPSDATDPLVTDVNFADQPIIIASIVSDLPVTEFKKLADALTDEIESVKGVSRAEVTGVRDREVTVVVRKEDLALHGLTLQGVVSAISSNDVATPVGSLEVDGVEYAIQFKGRLEEVEQVSTIPIMTPKGAIVRLSDIAFVGDGVEDASTISRVSVEKKPPIQAATLLVYKQRGADITSVSKDIATLIESTNTNNGSESQIVMTYDAGEQIITDLAQLTNTGMQTVGLVLLVLFLTLGWRAAIIASLSIPLSFLTALMVMKGSGNTLNFISLFSLILSIGILVDTAIVVVEAIHTNIKAGMRKKEAVHNAIHDFHYPLTTGNLTTIAVFVPLFTISGITGQFIKGIPFTVIAVLVSSLVISLAFIPLFASTFLRSKEGEFEGKQEFYANKVRTWYKSNIPWLLDSRSRKRWFVGGLTMLLVVLMILPYFGIIKVSFFPQGDVDYLYLNLEEPQGTPLTHTDISMNPVEDILMEIPEIESFTTTIGAGSAFDQNPGNGPRFGSITVNLFKERDRSSSEILKQIEDELAPYNDLNVSVYQPSEGPPSGSPVLVTFYGDDTAELKKLANDAADILRDIEGTRTVSSSGEDDANEFSLSIDREKAASLGLSPAIIAGTLRTAVFGTEATTIKKNGEEIDVVVKLNLNTGWTTVHDTNRTTLDAIAELPISTPNGRVVLLGSVLTSNLEASSDTIQREDEKRIATASSQVEEGYVAREVSQMFEERFNSQNTLPQGVTMKLGGETEDVDQSFKDMFRALLLGIIFVFAVLIIQFNKYREAFIVLSVVPLSLIGVLLGLLLTQEYLSFPSMLGFIALAGIVVNNAIILVDVWNRMRIDQPEMSLRDVVIEGASLRLRPILLTSVTTIVGITPLIFASDLWRPIAIAIMFGLMFAVVLTLLLVPALYLKFCKYTPKKEDVVKDAGDEESGKMEHITEVLKKKYDMSTLIKSVFVVILVATSSLPLHAQAFVYDAETIHTVYHEAPSEFTVDANGDTLGTTVSGMAFRQYSVANAYNIRLQRFAIGMTGWYVSDRGIIWADDDLTALSIYLSRVV